MGGKRNHDFIVFGTKNFGWNNNAVMLLDPQKRYAFKTLVRPSIVESNARARQAFAPDVYVDLLTALGMDANGGADGRVPVFSPDRKFISQDREHLTVAGARYLAVLLKDHPALAGMRAQACDAGPSTPDKQDAC
jgi:hypothetical protein